MSKKPRPQKGMKITWIDPKHSVNKKHAENMIEKYGRDGIEIVDVEPLSREPCERFFVYISINGKIIKSSIFEDCFEVFDWYWFQPVE